MGTAHFSANVLSSYYNKAIVNHLLRIASNKKWFQIQEVGIGAGYEQTAEHLVKTGSLQTRVNIKTLKIEYANKYI